MYRGGLVRANFDRVFSEQDNQIDVFDYFSPVVDSFVKGTNCSVMAYGNTGAGKTYTMYGANWMERVGSPSKKSAGLAIFTEEKVIRSLLDSTNTQTGLVVRMVGRMFENLEKNYKNLNEKPVVTLKFFQIYNEKILDLIYVE